MAAAAGAEGDDPRVLRHCNFYSKSGDQGFVLVRYARSAGRVSNSALQRFTCHVASWVALLPPDEATLSPATARGWTPATLLAFLLRKHAETVGPVSNLMPRLQRLLALIVDRFALVPKATQGWKELREAIPKKWHAELRASLRSALPSSPAMPPILPDLRRLEGLAVPPAPVSTRSVSPSPLPGDLSWDAKGRPSLRRRRADCSTPQSEASRASQSRVPAQEVETSARRLRPKAPLHGRGAAQVAEVDVSPKKQRRKEQTPKRQLPDCEGTARKEQPASGAAVQPPPASQRRPKGGKGMLYGQQTMPAVEAVLRKRRRWATGLLRGRYRVPEVRVPLVKAGRRAEVPAHRLAAPVGTPDWPADVPFPSGLCLRRGVDEGRAREEFGRPPMAESLRGLRRRQTLVFAQASELCGKKAEHAIDSAIQVAGRAYSSNDPQAMVDSVVQLMALLSPPRRHRIARDVGMPMPEPAKARLQAARQTHLRSLLSRLLGLSSSGGLDLQDAGTLKLLAAPLDRLQNLLDRCDWKNAGSWKQWEALAGAVGDRGCGMAGQRPLSACAKAAMRKRGRPQPLLRQGIIKGLFMPPASVVCLQTVERRTNSPKRVECQLCGKHFVSDWYFIHPLRPADARVLVPPIHKACRGGGVKYVVLDGSKCVRAMPNHVDFCQHKKLRLNCRQCCTDPMRFCSCGKQRHSCRLCNPQSRRVHTFHHEAD